MAFTIQERTACVVWYPQNPEASSSPKEYLDRNMDLNASITFQ